ncbi:MAG: baseplate J/gp47 family protein [Aliarcobacter butzleri]|nr:baseplate J/gp47 family protein [Aliarcobacter butzleri]
MEDIFKKLKTDFEFITGFIYKGLVSVMGAGFASRLKEFADKLKFIEKNAFISTADKDYLYLNASTMLPPYPAEVSKGVVVCYGAENGVIPAGQEIKDDNNVYKTISDATISKLTITGTVLVDDGIALLNASNQLTNTTALINGMSMQITVIDNENIKFENGNLQSGDAVTLIVYRAVVNVIANDAGIASNRTLNDVLKLKTTIAGVNTEVGVLQIDGGKDDEDVEDYRLRVREFLSNPQAPFSKPNIKYVNKTKIPSLKYIWIKNNSDDNTIEDGEIKIVALNNGYSLTTYEIEQITKFTLSIAPANFSNTAISVTNAIVENVDVVIQDLSPASDGLKNEVKKNIQYFFDADMFEKNITQANLEAIIYKTTNSAETVESFTLISGWKTAENYKFWKLNNVIFQ